MKHPTYLFSDRQNIKKALRGKFLYLFLDFDGTLAPIAETPGSAIMPEGTKDLLRHLSKMPNCKVAVISGRPLADISRRIGLKNIVYVGNHGFEIKGPKINFKSPVPLRYRRTLEEIKAKLTKALSSKKGVFIEDKGISLSLHYRLADSKDIPAIHAEFYGTILRYELQNKIQTKPGKMVLEVRPLAPWDKGKVILWLLGRGLFAMRDRIMKVFPIYIGDDVTDEDAFEALGERGMTIFVGAPKKTKARFYIKDTKEAARFLREILENIKSGIPWPKKR